MRPSANPRSSLTQRLSSHQSGIAGIRVTPMLGPFGPPQMRRRKYTDYKANGLDAQGDPLCALPAVSRLAVACSDSSRPCRRVSGRHVPGARRSARTRQPRPPRPPTIIASGSRAMAHRSDANGFAVLTGHVQVHQDLRTISADRVTYDQKTGKVTVDGSVDFEDPLLGVTSQSGAYDALGGASFDRANFHIFDRNGRGFAKRDGSAPGRHGAPGEGSLHELPDRQRGLDVAGLLAQAGHRRAAGGRAPGRDAIQGRADFLHALYRVSAG